MKLQKLAKPWITPTFKSIPSSLQECRSGHAEVFRKIPVLKNL